MDLGLSTIGPNSTEHSIETAISSLSSLHCHCFAHNRAATGENLEVGHASPTWRGMTSGGGEGAKSGG